VSMMKCTVIDEPGFIEFKKNTANGLVRDVLNTFSPAENSVTIPVISSFSSRHNF